VGDLEQALIWLRRAHELTGWDILRLHEATLLPPFMESTAQIREARARMASELEALQASGPVFSEREVLECPNTGFYLAYHGLNDCELQRRVAALYIQARPSLACVAPHVTQARAPRERIRIAFVSRYLYNHSVGNFFNPVIKHLCGLPGFEVLLFSIGAEEDEVFTDMARACAGHVRLAADSLDEARRAIAEAEPDILVYPEIGMDPFTYMLAFSRLGRVQCVLHGHSATTGIPNIDYFVSSALMEPQHGQEGYTERLICLPTLFMYLSPPDFDNVQADRASFGLPATGPLYLCPMKLQKIHPDMDAAFGEILRRDADSRIVLIEDHDRSVWRDRLAERLARKLPDVFERVIFLPWIGQKARFASLIKSVDVVLDSFHHGGATTAHIVLATGTPIVSWLTGAARPHIARAYYTLMGVEGCIADTVEGFIELALCFGQDKELRARIGEEIRRNRHRLYDNDGVFAAHAECFRWMAHAAQAKRSLVLPYIPLVSTRDWCARHGARCEVVEQPKPLSVRGATIFGAADKPAETATTTPATWLAELHDVSVIGGHGLILADGGTQAIHAQALDFPPERVQIADHLIYQRLDDRVLLHGARQGEARVEEGIWLAGKGSTNYYHWLLEYLPRLSVLDRYPEYDHLPLLIDAGLHPNLIAALERITLKRRPLVELESGRCHALRKLVVPSSLVKTPFEYRPGARVFDDDVIIPPAAIDFLRRVFAPLMAPAGTASRRIYVPRRGAKYRELINEPEIMAFFEREGFEVVYPEKLSFEEQVRVFSEAAMIVGPSGAGMTNILFAPREATTLMLSFRDDSVDVPYLVFANLAQALGQEMVFVLGEPVANATGIAYQSDYVVPVDLVEQAMRTRCHLS
ncbi:glycosyltransferase 61 family protein, partial [Hyphomicrobium sp.]|uniref:glycosyltransferase 61 family protein n=1 Tax=Hyphomicrobium sp. TaxID=82 RepID=UPI0025C15D45